MDKRNGSLTSRALKFRRRRTLFVAVTLLTITFLYYTWGLPADLQNLTTETLSRARVVSLLRNKTKPEPVDEIYGLLHLVTSEGGRTLTHQDGFHPEQQVELAVYAGGDKSRRVRWGEVKKRIDESYPVVVFSKSYCGFSYKAKTLLQTYHLIPPPNVIEVDLRDDGDVLKVLLTRLTKRSTFPNVIVQGKSIGGADTLQSLHETGELKVILERAGAKVGPEGNVPRT